MRVSCPGCAAIYDVPEPMLATPRPLRCHRCSRIWTPVPIPVPAAEPAADPPPRPTARRPPPMTPLPRRSPALPLAWAASVLVVAGGLAGLVVFAAEVVDAFPPAARLYQAVGLEPAAATEPESDLSTSPAR